MHYILESSNPINVFSTRYYNYELELYAAQEKCPSRSANRYFKVYYEKDYAAIIKRIVGQATNSRGGKTTKPVNDYTNEKEDAPAKTYGLFIATDEYAPHSNWQSLSNPINDARSVSEILKEKYGVEIITYYNAKIDDVWKGMDELFDKIREKDKLVVFIAGHGYYESKTGTAALPLSDSKSSYDDFRLTTYLEFSYLRQRLDNLPTKNVFAIFDVCFGANFDANAHDLPIAQYESKLQDIDLVKFDDRMNEEKTRIFIASGKYEVPDYWNNSLDHSPFAAKLIHGLKKEKQFVTPTKLYGYATANATKPELKYFGQHHTHSDFVLKVR
ncbi:MAG: hypothetical protein ACI8SE_000869 [Bacteroidia bacterium]|jgi:hypothetical protein